MSTPVVLNGTTYFVPAFGDTGYAQGPGNLSSYLIALSNSVLQISGGNFFITSDINFGTSFGLIAKYYTSTTSSPATVGTLRLAKTDTIDWRNNADSANLALGINGLDQLTYNGAVISAAGTTALTNTHIFVGNVSNIATDVALSGDATLANTGALTLNTVNGNVGSFTNSSITVNAKGLITAAANGTTAVTSVSGTANQITSTGGTTPVLALANPLITPGPVTISGNLTFSPTTAGIVGTTTNNDTTAGNVGEYIEATVTTDTNYPASGAFGDGTSISLTAGDWDVSTTIYANSTGTANVSIVGLGISTTAGNSGTGLVTGVNSIFLNLASTFVASQYIPRYRVSIAGTTTHYMKIFAQYSGTTPTFRGYLSARRIR